MPVLFPPKLPQISRCFSNWRRDCHLIEGMVEGVVVFDASGRILHWNQPALEMHEMASAPTACQSLAELGNLFEISSFDGQFVAFENWPLSRLLRGEQLGPCE